MGDEEYGNTDDYRTVARRGGLHRLEERSDSVHLSACLCTLFGISMEVFNFFYSRRSNPSVLLLAFMIHGQADFCFIMLH